MQDRESLPGPELGEITVLVVDDEPSNVESLEKIFSKEGMRVLTAPNANPYSHTNTHDQWGNITAREGWGGDNPAFTVSYTNNKRAGATYDAAGNLTAEGGISYTYTAAGQQVTSNFTGFSLQQYYSGDALRAKKIENSVTTLYLHSTVVGGQIVAEITSAGALQRGYVYLGGKLLAVQQSNAVSWVYQDPFVKAKRVANSSGTVVSTVELDPWGGHTNRSVNDNFQPQKFATYIRDGHAVDDAMFRRYNRWFARFDQPDPYDGSYNLANPQTFNRYAFVNNDPVNFTDPTGLYTNCGQAGLPPCEEEEEPAPRNPADDLPNRPDDDVPRILPVGPPTRPLPGWIDPKPKKKLPADNPVCKALWKKIENIAADIAKRTLDLYIDKFNLPMYAPGLPRKESVQGHKDIIEDLRQIKEKREKQYDSKCERPDGPSGAGPAAEPAGSGAPSSNPGSAPGSDPKFIPLPPPILPPATVPRPTTPSVPLVVPLPKGIIWCIISRQCGQGGVIQTE
jgi:RHS repeat-associated protein